MSQREGPRSFQIAGVVAAPTKRLRSPSLRRPATDATRLTWVVDARVAPISVKVSPPSFRRAFGPPVRAR